MDLYLKRRGSCIISEADDNSQLRKHEQGNCPIGPLTLSNLSTNETYTPRRPSSRHVNL